MQGLAHYQSYLSTDQQRKLAAVLSGALTTAPFYTPTMPNTGQPFSVLETNCGPLGWVSDKNGYRYQPHHPVTKTPWPPIPEMLLKIWREVSGYDHEPEAALLNYYHPAARMGLHQDKDEEAEEAPVVSLSLGLSARFRFGGQRRRDPTQSYLLASGDVIVFGGKARLCYHGIDRILKTPPKGREADVQQLAAEVGALADQQPGRLNITLRRVTKP